MGVGNEEMDDNKIAENVDKIINTVVPLLPKNREQVKNFVIKTTMGKAIKFKM